MSSPVKFLTSLGQVMATMALYNRGHPARERALDDCLKDDGGFDHNAQALRVVTFAGASLSRVRRSQFDLGIAGGHRQAQRPADERNGAPSGRYLDSGIPIGIADYNKTYDLELWSYASLEAQIAAFDAQRA